jgi:hypothetical protein
LSLDDNHREIAQESQWGDWREIRAKLRTEFRMQMSRHGASRVSPWEAAKRAATFDSAEASQIELRVSPRTAAKLGSMQSSRER